MKASSVKDHILKKTAEELKFPEVVVEKVISHQFKDASKAIHRHSEIEISGFGTFLISQPKLKRKIEHHLKIKEILEVKWPTLSPEERVHQQWKLDNLEKDLKFFAQKIKTNENNYLQTREK